MSVIFWEKMNKKNKTRYRSLNKIASDSRVVEIWEEDVDGIWVLLANGYNYDGTSVVHEWTVKNVLQSFKLVEKGPIY
jgi:subtilisin-like proprotein convertase family protein